MESRVVEEASDNRAGEKNKEEGSKDSRRQRMRNGSHSSQQVIQVIKEKRVTEWNFLKLNCYVMLPSCALKWH